MKTLTVVLCAIALTGCATTQGPMVTADTPKPPLSCFMAGWEGAKTAPDPSTACQLKMWSGWALRDATDPVLWLDIFLKP